MKDKTASRLLIFLFIGVIFVICAPVLFTRSWGFIDFTNTGTIGDTIGGITAPITSLIGSVLVFYALKAQIDANKLIQDQIESQKNEEIKRKRLLYLNELINTARVDINEFSYSYKKEDYNAGTQKFNYHGADAIYEFFQQIKYTNGIEHDENVFIEIPKLTELLNLLQIVDYLFAAINKENLNEEDRQFYKSLLSYQYNSKVKPSIMAPAQYPSGKIEPCLKCQKIHEGIPFKIFNLLEEIDKKIK